MKNMFERASRRKLRFDFVGVISVEDLWDLSLEHLNTLAKQQNKILKDAKEEDFLDNVRANTVDQLKFDIVLYILDTRKEEREKRENALKNKEKVQRLLEAKSNKENAEINDLSIEEIDQQIAELEE